MEHLAIFASLETKLRHFRYKIQVKYLSTNQSRSKWDKDMSPNCTFWLIWFINQRALYNHDLSVVRCCWRRPALASSSSVHTSPWHMVRHRNFIFGIHMHRCPPNMNIKYLMILTCSFKMAAILVFFFDLLSCPCGQS